MKLRTLFLLLVTTAVVVFVALNWRAITAPVPVSFAFATVDAPLGLILLGLGVAGILTLGAFTLYLQRTASRESAEQARRFEAQRQLAEEAEASRFTELQKFLGSEFRQQAARDGQLRAELVQRLDELERDLRVRPERQVEPSGELSPQP